MPSAKLSSDDLKEYIIELLQAVQGAGGTVISVICDNCRTNLSVFFKLGGPGQVFITSLNAIEPSEYPGNG